MGMTNIASQSVASSGFHASMYGSDEPTMSSREIAELVEKRHDNVKRTIESLVERGVIARPQIEDVQEAGGNSRVYVTQEYRVGKRDSYVIVAQLSPEFGVSMHGGQAANQNYANQNVRVEVEVFVNDDGTLGAIARQAGGEAANVQVKQGLAAYDKVRQKRFQAGGQFG